MSDSVSPATPPLTATEIAYGRFVPLQFLQLLGRPSIVDVKLGDNVEQEMTLLFSDIRDFTSLSESILPAENFRFINSYLSTMEPVVARHRGIIDKYIGDGIMALFSGSADDGVRSGIDMLRQLTSYNQGRSRAGYSQIRIGIGINTGLVMMGTVGGHNRMDSTVIGDAVNLASRLEGLTKIYSTPMLISAHTLHALKDPSAYCIRFLDRLQIKGRYQAQSLYEVFDADPEPLRLAKLETRDRFERALAYYHLGRADLAIHLLRDCMRIAPEDQVLQVYLERCQDFGRRGHLEKTDLMNMEIGWREDYSIGIAEIDIHHQDLVASIARLAEQVGRGETQLSLLLDGLEASIDTHFDTEEQMMLDHCYPFVREHKTQHDTFRRFLSEMRQEIESAEKDRLYLVFRIQLQLVDWLITHITKNDIHLGNFLMRAGVV
jgi:hemerythrin-like metal-binding protein